MIFQIRPNVFETNSSSTHSLNICTKEEFENWKNDPDLCYIGEAWGYFTPKNFEGRNFVTKEEVQNAADKTDEYKNVNMFDEPEDYWSETPAEEENIYTYETWCENEYLTNYTEYFTTPSGDKMVAFGVYGTQY